MNNEHNNHKCNECGAQATFFEKGWLDDDGFGPEDSWWCDKHQQGVKIKEAIEVGDLQ